MSKRLAVFALGLMCAACSRQAPTDSPQSVPPAAAPPTSAPPTSAPMPPAAAMPADQANLLKLIAAVDAKPKDEAVFNAFCATLEKTPDFKNWTGTVDDVQTSTVNGSIDITFGMGKHLKFEPVVQKGDALYPAVAALTVGDAVTLSGRFSHNKGSSECTYYLSSFAVTLTKVATR